MFCHLHMEDNNNNDNNNRICIARVCGMTSEALDGQLQSCYAARARPKCLMEEKCFRLRLNRARELQHKVQRVPDGRSRASERAVGEVSSGSQSV